VPEQDLKQILNEWADERRSVSETKHKVHHDFVETLIIKAERNEKRIEKFKTSAIGALGVGFVSFLLWLGNLMIKGYNGQ